jgi:glycosyltransferase involved in cell wall biosynthesis
MACEKAIVASALMTYKEMLGRNERGILVELFDREYSDYVAPLVIPDERIENLAEAIMKLAEDQILRTKLGTAARDFVIKNYNWETVIKRIENVYSGLIK